MKKVLSIMLAVLLVAVMAVPAFAADPGFTGTTVTFKKDLVLPNHSQYTVIPTLTFKYTITAGEAVAGDETHQQVLAGIGTPTVSDAVFRAATGTTTTQNVTIDFNGIAFPHPGVYRYILTEDFQTNSDAGVEDALTYDRNSYLVDVRVTGDTTYQITNAIMYKLQKDDQGAIVIPEIILNANKTEARYANIENKVDTITNKYDINHLKVTKTIAGPNANKADKFEFVINLANGPKNTTTKYDLDGTVYDVAFNGEGTASVTVQLGDSSTIEFYSLPIGTTYTVKENLTSVQKGQYKIAINDAASENGETSGTISNTASDVSYKNTAGTITPTGLFLTYGPYVLLVIVAIALAIVFMRKRNNRLVDELA